MPNTVDDLWPENITSPSDERPPLVILAEQADLLTHKVAYVIQARAEPMPMDDDSGNLLIRFLLIAPSLRNYMVELLTVVQPPSVYPSTLISDRKDYVCRSEAEFKEHLKRVFASKACSQIISSLIAQSKAITS